MLVSWPRDSYEPLSLAAHIEGHDFPEGATKPPLEAGGQANRAAAARRRAIGLATLALACTALVSAFRAPDSIQSSSEDGEVIEPTVEFLVKAGSGFARSNCHTAVSNETCYRNVLWAMQDGIRLHPEWYPNLTNASSFEEFQDHLHSRSHHDCPSPCARVIQVQPHGEPLHLLADNVTGNGTEAAPDDEAPEQPPCHTALPGEPCYDAVLWAKQDGIYTHPAWYKRLNSSSSLESFQAALHQGGLHGCLRPCPSRPGENVSSTWNDTRDDDCHTAEEGEPCYDSILWVMQDGIFQHPEWYPGLAFSSRFEEFQSQLAKEYQGERKISNATCPQPCACHTAVRGEPCFDSVVWALRHGVSEHPEWYDGLSKASRFEEVQAHLHQDAHTACPLPCRPNPPGAPSLFCFSVARSTGYEHQLMQVQAERDAGIFGCDHFAVLSDAPLKLKTGADVLIETLLIGDTAAGVSKDGTAANTATFIQAWDKLQEDPRVWSVDWVIKADPDAVLLPGRLRKHLAPHSGRAAFVRNCNKFTGPGWPMMYGAIEALSRQAVLKYFQAGGSCKDSLPWQAWGEDVFMVQCLDNLGVDSVEDFTLVGDSLCTEADCKDRTSAAFHPFKSSEAWLNCWTEAVHA